MNKKKTIMMIHKEQIKEQSHCEKCGAETQPVKEGELDAMLEAAINTPPLKLKDLKEQLKKEREAKNLAKQNFVHQS